MTTICDYRYIHLPYCLKRQADGKYVSVNRNYKPIGFDPGMGWADYAKYPIAYRLKMTPKKAARLSYEGDASLDHIYLYADECVPTHSAANMKAYVERLVLLAKLTIIC